MDPDLRIEAILACVGMRVRLTQEWGECYVGDEGTVVGLDPLYHLRPPRAKVKMDRCPTNMHYVPTSAMEFIKE